MSALSRRDSFLVDISSREPMAVTMVLKAFFICLKTVPLKLEAALGGLLEDGAQSGSGCQNEVLSS